MPTAGASPAKPAKLNAAVPHQSGSTVKEGDSTTDNNTPEKGRQFVTLPDINNGREKYFPNSVMKEMKGYTVSMYEPHSAGQQKLLAVACRSDDGVVHAATWTDAEVTQLKQKKVEKLSTPTFWRSLVASVTKGDYKVTTQGSHIDFTLRSSKEPKISTLGVDLQPCGSEWRHTFHHIASPYISYFRSGKAPTKASEDDEIRLKKKEAALNLHESLVQSYGEGNTSLEQCLIPIKDEATAIRAEIVALELKMSQMEMKVGVIESGRTELDKIYDVSDIEPQSPKLLDVTSWTWEMNTSSKDYSLLNVAWSIFNHYGLIEDFNILETTFSKFWVFVETSCCDNPFHNAKRCSEVMMATHFFVESFGFGKYNNHEDGKVPLSKEDLLAMFLASGIVDCGHAGVDNSYIVKSKDPLATVYNDLFILEQMRMTIVFEILENENFNFMLPIEVDIRKEIRDIVIEVLFVRPNAKTTTILEKLTDFKEKQALFDWMRKDDVRMAMALVCRCADIATVWAKDLDNYLSILQRVQKEFYAQGDREVNNGYRPSRFMDTSWLSYRNAHDRTFTTGQIEMFEIYVLPLLDSVKSVVPGVSRLIDLSEINKKHHETQLNSSRPPAKPSELSANLRERRKYFSATQDRKLVVSLQPNATQNCIFMAAASEDQLYFSSLTEEDLAKMGSDSPISALDVIIDEMNNSSLTATATPEGISLIISGGKSIPLRSLPSFSDPSPYILRSLCSSLRFKGFTRDKDFDAEIEEADTKAQELRTTMEQLTDELEVSKQCVVHSKEIRTVRVDQYKVLEQKLQSLGCDTKFEEIVPSVRNPLAAPMPVGVSEVPMCRSIDKELFKYVKSIYTTAQDPDDTQPVDAVYNSCIRPYTTSDFKTLSETIGETKTGRIRSLLSEIDDWNFDVFQLQKEMSGSYTHDGLVNQPAGGSLFITMYALLYKYGLMHRLNLNEKILINWLSMIEAGYHPNPYHNSMHAADVLHVSHYVLREGHLIDKIKISDEDIFCTLVSAAIHDYNHPGINNAFHLKTQNYLSVLWCDRSVNENVHASSVFELMRLSTFDLLANFPPAKKTELRETIVELVLGTDMGLHAQILGRFKKKIEVSHRMATRSDVILSLIMAVKLADISNCGRPQKLYHLWCNQIADEFFMQGDRERLMGLPVSPFMDRYTTVMSKGQTAFMNYIVVPLFECMVCIFDLI